MRKVIIEARINEYAGRENPHVPWTVDEIIAEAKRCADAGAAIVHFHPRTVDGKPDHDFETLRDIIAGIRAATDILIHPTLGAETVHGSAETRLANIERLAAAGMPPDLVPLDMASTNADSFDLGLNRFVTDDVVYLNTTRTLEYFARSLRERAVTPYMQIWNVPGLRQMECFLKAGVLDTPAFLSLALTEGGLIATHPGTRDGLLAYLPFLPKGYRHHWSVTLFGGNLLPLLPDILDAGGHISVGIGDYPYPELGYPTNAALIERISNAVRDHGLAVASVDDVRARLETTASRHPVQA